MTQANYQLAIDTGVYDSLMSQEHVVMVTDVRTLKDGHCI